MYQQQSGVGGGMLKRHFTMIYSQLDELRDKTLRVESNIAEIALRMEGLNRKFSQIETSRSQLSDADRVSRELAAAVEELRRDVNGLRARFESELLSLGDPVAAKERPTMAAGIPPLPTPKPRVQTVQPPTPTPQPEPEPVDAPPVEAAPEQPPIEVSQTPAEAPPTAKEAPAQAPKEDLVLPAKEEEPQSTSEKSDDLAMKSLEEQLGLVPPSDATANNKEEEKKPLEKKKRRWL